MKKLLLILGLLLISHGAMAESVKTYYPNGKVQMETSDTMTKMYYEDGKVSMESPMRDGVPVGITKMFYPNGKLMREEDHDKKAWKQFTDDGKLQAEGVE